MGSSHKRKFEDVEVTASLCKRTKVEHHSTWSFFLPPRHHHCHSQLQFIYRKRKQDQSHVSTFIVFKRARFNPNFDDSLDTFKSFSKRRKKKFDLCQIFPTFSCDHMDGSNILVLILLMCQGYCTEGVLVNGSPSSETLYSVNVAREAAQSKLPLEP